MKDWPMFIVAPAVEDEIVHSSWGRDKRAAWFYRLENFGRRSKEKKPSSRVTGLDFTGVLLDDFNRWEGSR
jgi:hypothetical protein